MLSHSVFSHPQLCFSQIAKKVLVGLDLPNFQSDLGRQGGKEQIFKWLVLSELSPAPRHGVSKQFAFVPRSKSPDVFAASHNSEI